MRTRKMMGHLEEQFLRNQIAPRPAEVSPAPAPGPALCLCRLQVLFNMKSKLQPEETTGRDGSILWQDDVQAMRSECRKKITRLTRAYLL